MTDDAEPITAAARHAPRRPAVLQVLPSLVSGGVERGTIEVAAALKEAGWTAIVASAGGPMAHELARLGAVHLTLPVDAKNPFTLWLNAGRLAAAIRAHGIDIVHARSRAPAWSALSAARRTGRHFVTTFHNVYGAGNALRRRYNAVMGKGERVIAISRFVGEAATGIYGVDPAVLRIIPRGVDLARFDPERVSAERIVQLARDWRLPDGAPVIMLPGRLTEWKGQLDLLEAVAMLGRHDLRCLLIGSGSESYRARIENRVKQLGLGAMVQIVENCTDMPAAYMLADVVVSASNRPEGFGRVAIEAQAMGRPLVATAHGGSLETVQHGENGFLVEPSSPVALAEALRLTLALAPQDRQALAARAMAHARTHFTTSTMCARTLAVYEEVLSSAGER